MRTKKKILKKLDYLVSREIKYILIFSLTGIIVTLLVNYFGISKNPMTYRIIRRGLYFISNLLN